MHLPACIARRVNALPYEENGVGMSGSTILCYENMVLKISADRADHERSYNTLSFLEGKLPAPRIIEAAVEGGMCYMLMTRIRGKMACAKEYMDNAPALMPLLANAIHMLWNVNTADFPYQHMLKAKLAFAKRNVEQGLCSTDDAQPGTYGPNGFAEPAELYNWLIANKPTEQRVFSHGDLCLPNVFIENGRISGFIDLGWAGVTDIYQDIALCYRSLVNNRDGRYGTTHPYFDADALFDIIGIEPDRDKLFYYTMLDELL